MLYGLLQTRVRQLSRKTFLALTATYATSNTQRGIPELQDVTDMEDMYIYLWYGSSGVQNPKFYKLYDKKNKTESIKNH